MKTFIRILAVINLLFAAFHVLLAIQLSRLTELHPQIHSLLVMLAIGGTVFILFLGIAFWWTREVRSTSIGKSLLILGSLTYIIRAAEEVWMAPEPSMPILTVCAMTGLLHVVPLFGGRPSGR